MQLRGGYGETKERGRMKRRQREKLIKKYGLAWVRNQEVLTKMGYPIALSGKPYVSGVSIMRKMAEKMRYSIEYTAEEIKEAENKASDLVRELAKASVECALYGVGWAKVYRNKE
jgi:hypothetical protein